MTVRPLAALSRIVLVAAVLGAAALVLAPAEGLRGFLSWALEPAGGRIELTARSLLELRLIAAAAAAILGAGAAFLRYRPAAATRLAEAARRLLRSLGRDLGRFAGDRPALAAGAAGVLLRLAFLGVPVRHDEAKTFFSFVAKPFLEGLSNYYVPNNHILHTLLAHLAWRLFGDAPEALRLPAFLAGCALLPLTYLVGRRLFERRTALWATALTAAAPPLVDYATDARGYSLVGALALAAFWVLAGRQHQPLAWAAAAGLGALGFFAVPVMVLPLAALFLHRLLVAKPAERLGTLGRCLLAGTASVALAGALYLPAILRSGVKSLLANPYLDPRPLPEVIASIPGLLLAHLRYLTAGQWPAMALLLVPLLALLLPADHRFGRARRLFLAILLAALGVLVLQRVLPKERTWLSLTPLLLMCVSRAALELRLLAIRRRRPLLSWLAPVLTTALAAAVFAGNVTSANIECPEAESFARRIAGSPAPGAPVLTATPAAGPLRFYLFRQGFRMESFLWATTPPQPAPADGPLFVVVRRGAFTPAELGLAGLEGFRELASGPTSSLWLREGAGPRAPPSDVSFAPP